MCNRYVTPDQAAMERAWHIASQRNSRPFPATCDIAPSREVPVLWQPEDSPAGELELMSARWGLIPHSWTGANPPAKTHQAMSETAATNDMWRRPLRNARCIVPAVGWYAWPELEIPAQKGLLDHWFYIRRPGILQSLVRQPFGTASGRDCRLGPAPFA